MEATEMSINGRTGREDTHTHTHTHTHTVACYSAIKKNELIYKMESIHPLKSEIMPFAARWLDLETVILSKVRQRSRNIVQHPLCPVLCLVA